jgi:hypothetical protein
MMASVALVFSIMSVTPVARLIEARVPCLGSAMMTMSIVAMILIFSVPSIPFPMMTIAATMLVFPIVLSVSIRR